MLSFQLLSFVSSACISNCASSCIEWAYELKSKGCRQATAMMRARGWLLLVFPRTQAALCCKRQSSYASVMETASKVETKAVGEPVLRPAPVRVPAQ